MKEVLSTPQLSRAEQEAETESNRLIEQIRGALSAVKVRSSDEADTLEVFADRIERGARDLAFAIRELAQTRRTSRDDQN